jgi:hypothetical protein
MYVSLSSWQLVSVSHSFARASDKGASCGSARGLTDAGADDRTMPRTFYRGVVNTIPQHSRAPLGSHLLTDSSGRSLCLNLVQETCLEFITMQNAAGAVARFLSAF